MASDAAPVTDIIGIISVVYTLMMLVVSVRLGKSLIPKGSSSLERVVQTWMVWAIVIHATVEGPHLVLSLKYSVKDSTSYFARQWQEYGKADKRYLVSDPLIVSLELIFATMVTPLCALLVYAIYKSLSYRHPLQIVIATSHIFGGYISPCLRSCLARLT